MLRWSCLSILSASSSRFLVSQDQGLSFIFAFHCHLAESFDHSRCLIDVGLVEFNRYRIIDTLGNFKVILAIPLSSSGTFLNLGRWKSGPLTTDSTLTFQTNCLQRPYTSSHARTTNRCALLCWSIHHHVAIAVLSFISDACSSHELGYWAHAGSVFAVLRSVPCSHSHIRKPMSKEVEWHPQGHSVRKQGTN